MKAWPRGEAKCWGLISATQRVVMGVDFKCSADKEQGLKN